MKTQFTRLRFRMKQKKNETLFTVFYFLVSALEIAAEYFSNVNLIYGTKPLIILFLVALYWYTSFRINYLFIMALLFSWLANIFFISHDFQSVFVGAVLFFIYRVLGIIIILRHIKLPSAFPLIIGCVPFLFIYMYVVNLTYEAIGEGLVIFICQCVLISFLGGLSVGNYILRSNTENTLLLVSTLFFAVIQFIFVVRLYYIDVRIFQSVAMVLFVMGQYMFYKFVVISEKKKAGYQSLSESMHEIG